LVEVAPLNGTLLTIELAGRSIALHPVALEIAEAEFRRLLAPCIADPHDTDFDHYATSAGVERAGRSRARATRSPAESPLQAAKSGLYGHRSLRRHAKAPGGRIPLFFALRPRNRAFCHAMFDRWRGYAEQKSLVSAKLAAIANT
jgi:hypothetical protein